MKRYILFLWGVLGVFLSSYAQNVYTCRYWFDQNHSTSVVESFTDSVWHGNIDVASLTNGLHTLNLQVKDTSNRWNSPRSYMFVKVPDSIARQAVEYICWFDSDYSSRIAGNIGNGHILLDVAGLSEGEHTVNMTLKHGDNYTSTRSYIFIKLPQNTMYENTDYICWFDSDYSSRIVGNIGNGHILLDVAGLRDGVHTVNISLKHGDNYTSTRSYMFVKVPDSTVRENMEYICWFDRDYSTRITGNVGDGNIMLNVENLRDGLHTVNITLKHGDNYTSTHSYMFVKVPDSTVRENMEYYCWFDNNYSTLQTGPLGNGHISLDVDSLAEGMHTVTVMVKGNSFSPSFTYTFEVPNDSVFQDPTYQEYLVRFVNYDSTVIQWDSVMYGMLPIYTGSTPQKPSTPQYSYIFRGWNPAVDTVRGNATYMAMYDSVLNHYLVSFVNYDGSLLQQDSVAYGDSAFYRGVVPQRPAVAPCHYTFAGWMPEIGIVDRDTTFVAQYDSIFFAITCLSNDTAMGNASSSVPQYGVPTVTLTAVANASYRFVSWNDGNTDNPRVITLSGDTVFTALFEEWDDVAIADTIVDVITACDSFTWINGVTYTESNNTATYRITQNDNDYYDGYGTTEGGDEYGFIVGENGDTIIYIITVERKSAKNEAKTAYLSGVTYQLNLTIHNSFDTTIYATICADSVYTENGFVESIPGVYTNTHQTINGCDSTVTLVLSIDSTCVSSSLDTIVDVVVACDSYTWIDGVTYTESNNTATYRITQNDNDYYDGYGTTEGGDEYGFIVGENGDTIIYIITVERKSAKNEAKTAYLSGVTYQLNLTIHNSFDTTIYATICADSVYTENGFVESIPGVYTNTHQTINGCDSTVTLVLSIDSTCVSSSLDTIVDVVVACDSYTWIDGVTYTESNNTATYRIVVNNGDNEGVSDSIPGFEVSANIVTAVDRTTSNSIYNGLRSSSKSSSRDTIMVLNLTINYSTDTTIYDTICANSMYVENGFNTNVAGIYTDTLQTVNGCDSIVRLVLTVNSVSTGTDSITAYDSYTWIDGVTYTASNNTATYTLTNAAGCDSVVTLNLTINSSSSSIGIDSIIAFYSYTWIDGVTYTESTNTPTYHLYTVDGLDSIVILNLSIINIIDTMGDGGDIVITPDPDYIIGTLNYGDTILLSVQPESCYHFVNWSDGVTDNPRYIVATGGITLSANYARNDTLIGIDTVVACSSYTWINGETYTTSVVDTFALTSANGCDSLAVLNLTISNAIIYTDVVTACGSFTWIDGYTYTSSTNTPTYTITSESGCDSIINLHLTIKNNSYSVDTQIACDTYTWIDGNTYVQSTTTPTYTLTAANGCDSIVTLNLTINHSTTGVDVVTACDSYTWIDGVTYTASNNTATYTLTNAAGCDSIVTLNLTINNSSTTVDNVTACDSYTWIDGVTYTESTDSVTYTLTNAAGCDSIVTLNLTITNSTIGTDSVTACDSYTWIDGVTYTESTDSVTYTLTNAAGCDSVVTLILTINHSVYDTIVDTAMNEYTWNGTTYTESGVYEYAGETTEGCDSIVTLMLTITTVGIDVADELESLTFYPNPTSGTITFNRTDITKIEVMDAMGRIVAELENSYVINLSNLSKGYYTLRITTPHGTAICKVIRN